MRKIVHWLYRVDAFLPKEVLAGGILLALFVAIRLFNIAAIWIGIAVLILLACGLLKNTETRVRYRPMPKVSGQEATDLAQFQQEYLSVLSELINLGAASCFIIVIGLLL